MLHSAKWPLLAAVVSNEFQVAAYAPMRDKIKLSINFKSPIRVNENQPLPWEEDDYFACLFKKKTTSQWVHTEADDSMSSVKFRELRCTNFLDVSDQYDFKKL